MPSRRQHLLAATVVALWAAARPAHAGEAWLLRLELPVAKALTQPQSDQFGFGVMPALGVARAVHPRFLLGAHVRAGALLDGSAPEPTRFDPKAGGMVSLRLRPLADVTAATRTAGLWVEGAGGAGLTGSKLRPAFEVGLGWDFVTRGVSVGPFVRYLQIIQPSGGLEDRDAKIGLLGVALTLFDERPAPPAPKPTAPPRPAPAPAQPPKDRDGDGILDPEDECPLTAEDKDGFRDEDGCPETDNDGDGILDAADKCPLEREIVNGVDDNDGCPDEGVIALIEDRIVLTERVLFDKNRARVKSGGKVALKAVVALWKQHPEWDRLLIEGHADETGGPAFNQRLSEERANRVRAALQSLGLPAEKMTTQGFGNSRPRVPGRDADSLQQNRRVELVVIAKRPAEDVTRPAPALPPSLPERNELPTAPPRLDAAPGRTP